MSHAAATAVNKKERGKKEIMDNRKIKQIRWWGDLGGQVRESDKRSQRKKKKKKRNELKSTTQ